MGASISLTRKPSRGPAWPGSSSPCATCLVSARVEPCACVLRCPYYRSGCGSMQICCSFVSHSSLLFAHAAARTWIFTEPWVTEKQLSISSTMKLGDPQQPEGASMDLQAETQLGR